MVKLAETMDQAACPVEYTPSRDSTGVKAMADKEGKYLTFTMADEEYGIANQKKRVRESSGDVNQWLELGRLHEAKIDMTNCFARHSFGIRYFVFIYAFFHRKNKRETWQREMIDRQLETIKELRLKISSQVIK